MFSCKKSIYCSEKSEGATIFILLKYHVQLQKSIYCSKKSEGATICILLKKTCNFIRKKLQFWEVYKNTRSSHQRCSIIKGVLINFAKFTGKQLCQSLFLNKVADLRPMICQGLSAIFIITKLQHKSCNIFIIKHL